MTDSVIIDLVCREVICEDDIEPGGEQAVDNDDQEKRSKTNGIKKRRMLVDTSVDRDDLEYEDPLHSLLPLEMRCKIFSYFCVSELLSFRCVSRRWNTTVDSILRVNAKIDSSQLSTRDKCTLPMKSCTLIGLQGPCFRQLFRCSTTPSLTIVRGVSSANFGEMLTNWSWNLTKLELCWRTIMKNLLFDKKILRSLFPTMLPQLSILTLEILLNDNLGERTQSRIKSNLATLSSFDYPSLQQISLMFIGYRELHVQNYQLDVLLPFLRRHSDSLLSIEFTLKYTSAVIYPPVHPRHILFCVPTNLKTNYSASQTTHEGSLITTRLTRGGSYPDDLSKWKNMLESHRKLEVAITTRFLNWTIKHLSFFNPMIIEYSQFLRRLDIMNVTMYDSGAGQTATQLDAKVFQTCVQLAELRLYRAPIIFHEEELEPPSELINLHLLPKSLEKLVIDGLPVESVELLATVQGIPRLSCFHYFQSPVPQRNHLWMNGVNWDVLSALVQHRAMTELKVHVAHEGQMASLVENFEQPLSDLALDHGWTFTGLFPGHMNLFQITMSKTT